MKVTRTLMSVCALGISSAALAIPAAPDEAGIVRNPPSHETLLAGDRSVDAYFARYDTNRDGAISLQEAQQDPDLAAVFERSDVDGDRA